MRALTRVHRRLIAAPLLATLVVSLATIGPTLATIGAPGVAVATTDHDGRTSGPDVNHTKMGPTGYAVTFKFVDKKAKRVQLRGEWAFTAADGVTPVTAAKWIPGAFVSGGVLVDLKEIGRSGVWTYTTPLPSGTFNYGFLLDCASDTGAQCAQVADPANPAWNVGRDGRVIGTPQVLSQIYVPSDPAFGTIDNSWQAPPTGGQPNGFLASLTYPSPGHVTPKGSNLLAIYTPPRYDANRAQPYPTLYLSHGGGGSETDWSTQGNARNILDGLINTGQIEPMVVVMVNLNGYELGCPASGWESQVADDIVGTVVPLIESRFNVASDSSRRAFGGLSCGGVLGHELLIDHTEAFGYYGLFSPGGGRLLTGLDPATLASFDGLGIFVGVGYQEPLEVRGLPGSKFNAVTDVRVLSDAGIAVTPDFMNGVHSWPVWRVMLKDFLLRVAFKPPVDRLP